MMMDFIPKVVQAVPGKGHLVYAYFDDGSIHLFDAAPLIREGTVFEPLADEKIFRQALTVMNDTVAFDLTGRRDSTDCIDIDPETIYEGRQVDDPLKHPTKGIA